MKILIIPDVHGCTAWLDSFKKYHNDVDHIVFLGDYLDSFNENEQGENGAKNLENILETTEPFKNKTALLFGNHDLCNYVIQGGCSGFQVKFFVRYNQILQDNLSRFKIGVNLDNWVFSHAGFSKVWYENLIEVFRKKGFTSDLGDPLQICDLILENKMFQHFDYIRDPEDFRRIGESIKQGPLWIRPTALIKDMYYPKQVVGHTEFQPGPLKILNKQNNTILFCTDTQAHDKSYILDTETGTLNVEPQTFKMNDDYSFSKVSSENI